MDATLAQNATLTVGAYGDIKVARIRNTTGGSSTLIKTGPGALTFAGVKSLAVSGAAVPGAMTLLWWAASIWRRNGSGTD